MENPNVEKRINELKAKLEPVLKQYPVVKAGFFGSVTREDYDEDNSDIDVLIELEKNANLGLKYMTMILEMEDSIGKKIDLVEYEYVHPMLSKYILPNEIRIYEK